MGKKKSNVFKLIDEEDDYFSTKAEEALKEIFSRYDKDGDQCLSDKELDDFAIGCNGKPFDKVSISEIKDCFDCNEKQWLTFKGFMEMYYMQTISEPAETWKDIEKHGYDRQCNLIKNDSNKENKKEEKEEEEEEEENKKGEKEEENKKEEKKTE
ncbi:hypothetical protein ACTA71_008036 [Dictyostelium dimigraforme]